MNETPDTPINEGVESIVKCFRDRYCRRAPQDTCTPFDEMERWYSALQWIEESLTDLHSSYAAEIDAAYKRGLEQSQEVLDEMMEKAREEERAQYIEWKDDWKKVKKIEMQQVAEKAKEEERARCLAAIAKIPKVEADDERHCGSGSR
jgi:hypothetical protein